VTGWPKTPAARPPALLRRWLRLQRHRRRVEPRELGRHPRCSAASRLTVIRHPVRGLQPAVSALVPTPWRRDESRRGTQECVRHRKLPGRDASYMPLLAPHYTSSEHRERPLRRSGNRQCGSGSADGVRGATGLSGRELPAKKAGASRPRL